MKVLLLVKGDNKDKFVVDFANKINSKLAAEFHVLNVVSTPGDIPVKENGQILDDCSEFDLSEYISKQLNNKKYLLDTFSGVENLTRMDSLVGNPLNIISNYVQSNQIDLVFSGAHVTSTFEDLTSHSFAETLMHELDVPCLSLKCDRSWMEIERIGLVRDFKKPKVENLRVLKAIQKAFNAKLFIFKINTEVDFQTDREVKLNMKKFTELNELSNVEYSIYCADSKEQGVNDIILDYGINIMALGQIDKKGIFSWFSSDLKTDVLNHVAAPLYMY